MWVNLRHATGLDPASARGCQAVSTTCRTTSQYCPVRSADFCRYGPTSHSLYLPQVLHRVVRPRIDERLCGAAEFASGLMANGLVGSMVICCCQAKQLPSADAFPLKPSPSSLSWAAGTAKFLGASAQPRSPSPAGRFARRTGGNIVVHPAWLDRIGIAIEANRGRAVTEGKKLIRH